MEYETILRELNRLQQENAMLRDLLAKHRIPIPLLSTCVNEEKALCKTPGTECSTRSYS